MSPLLMFNYGDKDRFPERPPQPLQVLFHTKSFPHPPPPFSSTTPPPFLSLTAYLVLQERENAKLGHQMSPWAASNSYIFEHSSYCKLAKTT
jgi:hypothetical protein